MGIKADFEEQRATYGLEPMLLYRVFMIGDVIAKMAEANCPPHLVHALRFQHEHLQLIATSFGNMRDEKWRETMDDKGTNFDFGVALAHLKAGRAVARHGWNGKGMFICLMPALQLPPYNTQGTERKVNDRTAKWIGVDQSLDCQPYIAMFTATKQWQPGWLASQADMLANDWAVFEIA